MSVYHGSTLPMSAADKISTATGDRLVIKRHGDPIFYYGTASKVLGAFHLVAGLLSMALGVGAICIFASGYYIGYGIWAGFIFTTTGILAIVTAYYRNARMVSTTLIFCLLSCCCGIVQFSIGVVAAVNDRHRSVTGELSWDERYLQWDIYYRRNNPFHHLYAYYCTQTYGAFTWNSDWAPVDVLLLLTGAIEVMFAIASAALCCVSFCNGDRRVNTTTRGAYMGREGTGSFYNEAFDSRSRVSEPVTYKIVQR